MTQCDIMTLKCQPSHCMATQHVETNPAAIPFPLLTPLSQIKPWLPWYYLVLYSASLYFSLLVIIVRIIKWQHILCQKQTNLGNMTVTAITECALYQDMLYTHTCVYMYIYIHTNIHTYMQSIYIYVYVYSCFPKHKAYQSKTPCTMLTHRK